MGIVDFSRGELSPKMRYRSDLETYYKGVAILENFLPTPQSGLTRRPGTQVLGTREKLPSHMAIRTFNLGSTGLDYDIDPPGGDLTVAIGAGVYDTYGRNFPIKKNTEVQLLLAFSEPNTIEAYWLNTPDNVPAYIQTLWNHGNAGFQKPSLGFDDTRDVRVVQIESSVFIVAQNKIYKLYWDTNKPSDTSLEWNNTSTYNVGDVVLFGSAWLECIEDHDSSTLSPEDVDGPLYWEVVYAPHLSWVEVPVRVGRKLLEGNGTDYDPYTYTANAVWQDSFQYYPGDVVDVSGTFYEAQEPYISAAVPETPPSPEWRALAGTAGLSDDDKVYQRHSIAYREETIPREIAAHQGRLIMSASALYPATVFGSEISHYTNFGAGPNDDDPWIFTISGDRVGKILWMCVTDQLYLGTKGGIFGVAGAITPNQFLLRKITTHSASEVEGVAAAGNLLYFQGDRQTLREIQAVDAQQNYHAYDLTIYSSHLFEIHRAVKMVVQSSPNCIIWILREDGILVSLSYEHTTGMMAFARHTFPHAIIDITGGTGNDLYMAAESCDRAYLMRLGRFLMSDGDMINQEIHVDGQIRYVLKDTASEFAVYIQNDDFRAWMEAIGIVSIADMRSRTEEVNASGQFISGYLKECGLRYFASLASINLSSNQLDEWRSIPIPETWTNVNFADNSIDVDDVNQILIDLLTSVESSPRTGSIDLSGNAEATYEGLSAGAALRDKGWIVTLQNAGAWYDGYSFAYDGNEYDSGAAPGVVNYFPGETVTVEAPGDLARTGYGFIGWNTKADGTGTTYTPGDTFIMPSSGVTLYAKWLEYYSLAYDGNEYDGGIVPDDGLYHAGDSVTVPISQPTRTGYTFTNWNTKADGTGTSYSPGESFLMPSHDIELYAQWEIIIYTVSFDVDGGTPVDTQNINYGEKVTQPPDPEKDDSVFSGWYKNDEFSEIFDFANDVITRNTTIFAKWESIQVTEVKGYKEDGTEYTGETIILTRHYFVDIHYQCAAQVFPTTYNHGVTWYSHDEDRGVTVDETGYVTFQRGYDGGPRIIRATSVDDPNKYVDFLFYTKTV